MIEIGNKDYLYFLNNWMPLEKEDSNGLQGQLIKGKERSVFKNEELKLLSGFEIGDERGHNVLKRLIDNGVALNLFVNKANTKVKVGIKNLSVGESEDIYGEKISYDNYLNRYNKLMCRDRELDIEKIIPKDGIGDKLITYSNGLKVKQIETLKKEILKKDTLTIGKKELIAEWEDSWGFN